MVYAVLAVGNFNGAENPPLGFIVALYNSKVEAYKKCRQLKDNPDPRGTYGVQSIEMNSSQI